MGIKVISVRGVKKNDESVVYVGRDWDGWVGSVLGNKFRKRDYGIDECLRLYREWLRREWVKDGEVKKELLRLVEKVKNGEEVVLGCWCCVKGDEKCHGKVIKEVVEILISKGY